ncbi:CLUMA_CG005696, isoform A [Clunio marinus]|uniref:Dephospho-CoA kinase domain-containing protein n=1 Tax=Clunio marinus TaxID=568069 RepID=A0A1J1HXR3_9DIPT|nr:CLUMA_CG005696, isoform A [Clunio marinus]
MFLIAVTGGIACGKTTVCEVFQKYDIPVINADLISRQIVEPGKPVWKKIKEHFGDEVFNEDKTLNRDILGQIIFDSVEKRRILNRLTHPIIHRTIYKEIFKYFFLGKNFVVLELPLLFEVNSNLINYIHKIICVATEEDIQIARLMDRNNMSLSEAKKRIQAQMPLEEKCKMSHFVIENSGSQKDMEEQTIKIINMLLDSNHHWKLRSILMASAFSILAGLAWLLNRKYKFISN